MSRTFQRSSYVSTIHPPDFVPTHSHHFHVMVRPYEYQAREVTFSCNLPSLHLFSRILATRLLSFQWYGGLPEVRRSIDARSLRIVLANSLVLRVQTSSCVRLFKKPKISKVLVHHRVNSKGVEQHAAPELFGLKNLLFCWVMRVKNDEHLRLHMGE